MATTIQLRRDTEANWNLIANSWVPADGEICLIDVGTAPAIKYSYYKIGDGVTSFANLEKNVTHPEVISGYYLNGKFYKDSTYTATSEITPAIDKIYIDKNTNGTIYWYDNTTTPNKYISVNDRLPIASDTVAGIMKLYQTSGQNSDGAISQKCVTDGVDDIKFAVDETDEECLVLNKPW